MNPLKHLVAIGASLLLLCLAGSPAVRAGNTVASPDVRVTDGWVRLLPGGLPAAGYLTLHNDSSHEIALTAVRSSAFDNVHLHESYTTPDGNSGMRPVKRLAVPAHGEVRLAPGGYHLMLMGAKRRLKPGEKVGFEFRFAGGATLEAFLVARPADATGPGGK